ncbi:MAG: sodium/proton-translocating pyrophosphatase, partial [Deltaproteobacteria bacterium]|nr:sodium/proton-translocating pyrophosphatase [Deltaproteobacteria bacterium]
MSTRRLAAFALLGGGAFYLSPILFGSGGTESEPFKPFALFSDPRDTPLEIGALMAVLAVAVLGLLYAWYLARQVLAADTGTPKMQEVAAAVREGSEAYLAAQFKKIG